jgi:hypothetical protein
MKNKLRKVLNEIKHNTSYSKEVKQQRKALEHRLAIVRTGAQILGFIVATASLSLQFIIMNHIFK